MANRIPTLSLLTLALFAAACGDDGGAPKKSSTPSGSSSSSAAAESPDSEPEEPESAGRGRRTRDTGVDKVEVTITPPEGEVAEDATATLMGTVYLDGKIPKRRQVAMDHVPGCHKHGTMLTDSVIATEDGELQNVFVYISRGIDKATVPPPPEEPVVLTQEGCLYHPHALTVRAGQELVIKNLDGTNHNVNARPQHGSNRPFNTMQPPNGQDIVKTFPRAEVAVPFGCDIHPWMKSYVAVVDNDFHDITGEDGTWTIEGLPPGEYYVESWHERYKGKKAVLTLGAGETAEVTFRYDAKR